jgi:hypothetical protein
MGGRALALGTIALALAAGFGARDPAGAARASAGERVAALGPGAPDALLAAPLPPLRLAVPAGGHASLRVELARGDARGRMADAADVALVRLLGVPGEWPLEGVHGAAEAPRVDEREVALVPEPASLPLVLLGATLLGARPRAGRADRRTSP